MSNGETINFPQQEISATRQDMTSLQAIFKVIPDGVVFTDIERRIVMVNPALENIFGYREEELLGKKTSILYGSKEDYEEQGRIRFNLSSREKLLPYEVAYRKKDSTVFPSETIDTPLLGEGGEIFGFLGLIRDITSRKKAESALAEHEHMYRTVADCTYDLEIWADPDENFRYVSPSCERISGYTVDQFMKNPELFRDIIIDEDKKEWDEHSHDAREKHELREIQFRIKRLDGTIRWIEHACQPVVGPQGENLGFRASNRDITRRKKTEQELSRAFDEITAYKERLEKESACLREDINLVYNYRRIVGSSNPLQYVLFKIEQVAATDTTVLILGETGTGKDLFARAIHEQSLRKAGPMLTVNCAALPNNLIESELFGHEKGAFTGAHSRQVGRFEAANGGSLFLDEIGELPLASQSKLLRVLQDGQFQRLGSTRTTRVDVRVVMATNHDLEKDVELGRFRRDLWYRINVFPITLPPLRERPEDIPQLVEYFIDKFTRKLGRNITSIEADVLNTLQQYGWPGNVRELENVIERAVITTQGSSLTLGDAYFPSSEDKLSRLKPLAEMERNYILKVLEETEWKISGKDSAAEILGLKRSTLRAKISKLDIRRPEDLR